MASREQIPIDRLTDVVRVALGEPAASLGAWDATPLAGGFGSLAGKSGVALLKGTAQVGAGERAWSLVLKSLAPVAEQDDPSQIYYWKREPLLYQAGVLDGLPAGVRAPRCFGRDERPDGSFWLWLEHVPEEGDAVWPLARWGLAARHLGRLNGAYVNGRPLPEAHWLGGDRLRSWLERQYVANVDRIVAAAADPRVSHYWPPAIVDAIVRFRDEREFFLTALERLPQTFGHGDAIRRNLIAHRAEDGVEETVAVDWEFAGRYALGEEVGQTLSVGAAFFQLDPTELPALDEVLFGGYMAGLRDVGVAADERAVRFAYTAHAALRNLFNAVGATLPDEARRAAIIQNQGRSFEELAERRAAIRPFLLARVDEARRLLATL